MRKELRHLTLTLCCLILYHQFGGNLVCMTYLIMTDDIFMQNIICDSGYQS